MAFEQGGLVTFPVDSASASFRFTVVATDSTLRVWLEDCSSKEQWQTKELTIPDFVTLATAIPQARTQDYAMRVVECLAPTSSSSNPTRSLSRPTPDGTRLLSVGFEFQAMAFSTTLEYTFPLLAVKLDPVQLLSARLFDLEQIVKGGALVQKTESVSAPVAPLPVAHREQTQETWKQEMMDKLAKLSLENENLEDRLDKAKYESRLMKEDTARLKVQHEQALDESKAQMNGIKDEVMELRKQVADLVAAMGPSDVVAHLQKQMTGLLPPNWDRALGLGRG